MSSLAKLVVIVICVGALVGLLIYILNRFVDPNSRSSDDLTHTNENQIGDIPVTSNVYMDLRNQALSTKAEGLGIRSPSNETKVFGVIMDWNLGSGIATFISFSTGDASMYTSSGGGTIGGIGHENVRNASIRFVEKAETFVQNAYQSDDVSLAKVDSVKFFFLTNNGRFVAEEQMRNFDNGTSQWLELFKEANNVITELRVIADDFEN